MKIKAGEITALATGVDAEGHEHLAAQVATPNANRPYVFGTLHVREDGFDSFVRFEPLEGLRIPGA